MHRKRLGFLVDRTLIVARKFTRVYTGSLASR